MEKNKDKTPSDLEWEQRTLCIDESCIGVIGPDGRCKECGLPYNEGTSEEIKGASATEDFKEDTEEETTGEEGAEVGEDDPEQTPSDSEWEQRTLCIDESCIGVIGPDGRCKECGKPYK